MFDFLKNSCLPQLEKENICPHSIFFQGVTTFYTRQENTENIMQDNSLRLIFNCMSNHNDRREKKKDIHSERTNKFALKILISFLRVGLREL